MSNSKFEQEVLVSRERFSLLAKKSIQRQIETAGNIKLELKPQERIVRIVADDALTLWLGQQVIEAVGRGFSHTVAQKLFKPDNAYVLISLRDFGGRSRNQLQRLRSRVIGQQGRAKKTIQKYTNTDISIYGKTVAIIGSIGGVELARRAVEMLLRGAKHTTVYRFLSDQLSRG